MSDTSAPATSPGDRVNLGRIGVWTFALRSLPATELGELVGELEDLGYGAIWFPGGPAEGAFDHADALLGASSQLAVATGIVSIWAGSAERIADRTRSLPASHGDRFLLGLGVSHPEAVNRREPGRYRRPLAAMRRFLDELDTLGVEPSRRALAALGPAMLGVAGERAAGAHPYFVPVEHTAMARQALGTGPLLMPEQAVVLEVDPSAARSAARLHMAGYLRLTNYASNLRRIGFSEDDIAGPSERLVDAIVAWGDEEAIANRIAQHYDAGADHVCIQVLPTSIEAARQPPVEQWRRLAPALTGQG